jgi:hypothetical protein
MAIVCFALGLLYPVFLVLAFAFILPCVYEDFEIIGTREKLMNAKASVKKVGLRGTAASSSAAQIQRQQQQPLQAQQTTTSSSAQEKVDSSAPPGSENASPKFIPWGSPTLRVRDLHGNVLTINSDKPVPFESEYFKGVILVMMRQENGRWETHFQGKQRKIEVQVQGQIKKPVGPNIIMGAELQEKLEMGLVTRALVNILMAFCGKLINNFRYSFGEPYNKDGNYEVPYVCFPMFRTMDRVVITPEGETPPELGSELPEPDTERNLRRSGKSSGENLKFEMGKTYSFSFHSMYINFAEWAIINVPGYKAIDIKSIVKNQPARVVIYDIEEDQKHYSKNKRYIMYADFCHISIMSEHELNEYNRQAAAAAAAALTAAASVEESEQPSTPCADDIVSRPTEVSPDEPPEEEEGLGEEMPNLGEPKQSALEMDESMRRSLLDRMSKASSLLSTMALKDDRSSAGDQDDALADVPSNSFVPITILRDSSSISSAIVSKADSIDNSMWSGIGSSSSFAVIRDFEEVQSLKFIKLSAKGSSTPKRRTMVPWRSSRDRGGSKITASGEKDKSKEGDAFWGKNNREIVKSERLRNGDVVHIQSAATGDYLTIHRGWWLVWTSRVPHDKKGQFIITITDYDNSIKASPSPIFVGFPFRLRSHRWPSWQIGCQVIPSASYGGRLLTLFHTPKHGENKHDDMPPGAPASVPPAQNQSGKQSVQPLVLCVLPDSVCERHSKETERLIRHIVALNMFSRNRFFLGMRPQNTLSAITIPAKLDNRRPSNASNHESMSEQAGFRYFPESLLDAPDLARVCFELMGYVELLNRRTNQLQLMYMLYCEIPWSDQGGEELSNLCFSNNGNQVLFEAETPCSGAKMKSFVVLRSGNEICDTLRSIADSFAALMDSSESIDKSAVASTSVNDDAFSDGEPSVPDNDEELKSPQPISCETCDCFDFDFVCSNHQSSADESFQLMSSMIYFAQKKDRISSKPDISSYPARRNMLRLVAFESDYLTDGFANSETSPVIPLSTTNMRGAATTANLSNVPDASKVASALLQTALVARAVWDTYWREEIVQLYSQYMVFHPILPTDASKPKSSSKSSDVLPQRSSNALFTILLSDITSVSVIPGEFSKFPGYNILKIESVGRSSYIAFRKLDACKRFMASVLESKSNIMSSMSDVSEIPSEVAVVDPRDSFVHRSGRWRPHTRMLLNSRRFFFDADQARRMSIINPSNSMGKFFQLSYGTHSSSSTNSPSYWELSEKLLRDVYALTVSMGAPTARSVTSSSSPTSTSTFLEAMKSTDGDRSKGTGTDKLSTFLDDVSILKLVDLTSIDYSSREAVCFFGNIYHALLLHARLVLGSPTEDSWASFFDSVSYEIGGEVFSLVELEQCVLRGKLTRPMFIPKIGYTLPSVDDSRYEYALSAVDERIGFFLNQGSISGPDVIYVLTPDTLDEQLNEASRNALEFCLDINTAKRTVSLPVSCQVYAGDFIGVDANEMDEGGSTSRADLLLLKRCMRYMGAAQSENIIHLLTLPAASKEKQESPKQASRKAPAVDGSQSTYNSLTTSSEGSEVSVLYMPLECKSHHILTVK